ncbi:MAG TPA: hypothetical protein VH500_12850 [Nitrososphaeraceae archaeon]|jgi:hypothetical protein
MALTTNPMVDNVTATSQDQLFSVNSTDSGLFTSFPGCYAKHATASINAKLSALVV